MSFDSGEETDLNYSGGCLALPGWRSGPWGMQVRYDMRWNTLFTRRYFNEGSEWDDWVRLATCMPPEVHQLPLADGWTPLTDDCTYYKTQENIVTVNIRAQHSTTISEISRETVATLPTGFRPTRWISSACALDSGDSGGAMNGGVHVDANGSVIINGFDSYRVVYAQISFLAVN